MSCCLGLKFGRLLFGGSFPDMQKPQVLGCRPVRAEKHFYILGFRTYNL